MSNTSKPLTRKQAIQLLWKNGNLDWKLTPLQSKIKHDILNDKNKINVVVLARRSGKTYLLLCMAIEQCLQHPNSIVKFVFPKQKDAKGNIKPLMRIILEGADNDERCPETYAPKWNETDKCFNFPNGSVIQMTGSDNGNIDNVRGGFAHLCIVDEAGFVDDLLYGVRSVLSPTIKTTGGRIIMASTPSRSSNHEFITEFMIPYMAENRTKVYTIFDNPMFTPELVQETIEEYPAGVDDPGFRREYLCKIDGVTDESILTVFTDEKEKKLTNIDFVRPVYYHRYVSMDIGYNDLTVVLFGYFDYLLNRLVIEDEIVLDNMKLVDKEGKKTIVTREGQELFGTELLAYLINQKEKELYSIPQMNEIVPSYKRVSDNNLIVLNDLSKLHGLVFTATKKDDKQAAINALNLDISHDRVYISPKCQNLLYHMKFAEWNKQGTEFKRLKNSITGKLKGGHADGLDALIYMHRNLAKTHNPYPDGWGVAAGDNIFKTRHATQDPNSLSSIFNKLLNRKS